MNEFNWSNLKSHLGSQNRSFEELSKQLFRKECSKYGIFQEIGIPGQGQDGVEAVVVQKNGDEIGMQAKWFYPGTVKQSNRKNQIEESLKKASQRSHLKKWILCSPLGFDNADWTWWNSLKQKYPNLIIETPWLSSDLIGKLANAENFGLRSWFFGDLEFNHQWFENKFKSKIECISQKYLPALHVPGEADDAIQIMLGNQPLINRLKKVRNSLLEGSRKLENIQSSLKDGIKQKTTLDLINVLDKSLKSAFLDIRKYRKELKSVIELAGRGNLFELSKKELTENLLTEKVLSNDGYPESLIIGNVRKVARADAFVELKTGNIVLQFYPVRWIENDKEFLLKKNGAKKIEITLKGEFPDVVIPSLIKELKKTNKELCGVADLQDIIKHFVENDTALFRKELDKLSKKASEILSLFDELYNLTYSASHNLKYYQKGEIVFLSDPAIGKTHLVLKACETQLKQNKPAVLILGSQITNQDNLKKQVLDQLEVGSGFTWHQVIQGLEAYAEAHKTRILFVLDAINESPYWDNIVKEGLSELIEPMLNSDWFGVILTSRSSYAVPFFGKQHPENSYYLQNDMDIEEYRKAYFKEYKLITRDVSPSMKGHLENRFFVTLLSKVYGDPKADKPKEISLRELTINDLFEDFLVKIDASICRKLRASTGCQFIRKKLKKMCGYMFDKNLTQLSKYKALELIEEREPSLIRNDDSWLQCMVNEGLLVDFTWKDDAEVLEFSHQRVAEYMMACFVVEGRNEKEIRELIQLRSNHPRILDILEIVGTLTPPAINKHLYQFLSSDEKLMEQAQISAFFEMKPSLITDSEVKWLTNYFVSTQTDGKQFLLTRLFYSVAFEDYPFNARFVSTLLDRLSMRERDLIWSEWIRENTSYGESLSSLPTDFEDAIKKKKIKKERAILWAEYLRWFLTSTSRDIRDRTTRALYWYGRAYPRELCNLTIKSLGINDPYIPERLLASSYGVAMAFYMQEGDFNKTILPEYAKCLYKEMFVTRARYSTTHLLMRDYARRTIELALIQSPKILDSKQKKKIKPPFKLGGIRKWGESEDKNKDEYREGNYPLGFDWGNYTLGRIVPDRNPYQDTNEFKKVRRQIFWRIYELGYNLRDFGEIDKRIAARDHSFRADVPGKTERYGKKYCWIAYFELAGYRIDRGLLRDDWVIRGSEVDIDPSFPEPPSKMKVVSRSLIDNKYTPEQWVKEEKPVAINTLFVLDKLAEVAGKWVLLDGFISEKNKSKNKSVIIKIGGLLVDKAEAENLITLYMGKKKREDERDNDIPDAESDYYTYAGEIPWCETFPKIAYPQTIEFKMNDKRIVKKKITVVIPSFFNDKKKTKGEPTTTSIEQEVLDYEEMERQGIIKKIPVIVPVRSFSWESYHCALNQAGNAKVVNKEIAHELKLHIEPQGFNLFNRNGDQASFSIGYGSTWTNGYSMVYLREDLVKSYLEKHNKSLVWLIWGERQFEPKDYNSKEMEEFQKKYGKTYLRYKQGFIYS